MEAFLGYRKFIIVLVMMGVGTVALSQGFIDQDTFKWILTSSGVAYLGTNALSKFANNDKL